MGASRSDFNEKETEETTSRIFKYQSGHNDASK
jgi:hypothetical protein